MGKTWLKIGSHVQLKSDVSSDGKIITSHGKGNWTVAWEHSGVQSKHHSKGLKQWTFSAPLSDSSESENEEGSGDEDSDTGVPPAAVVAKVWAAMQKRGCKDPLTVGEWFVFLGLMCGATLYTESGRELWRKRKEKERAFSRSPGFAEFMTCERFEDIKACAVAGCTDLSQQGTEKWFKIKPAVDAFNKRRQEVVIQSEVLTPDETMSPMCPRSTSHGAGEGKLPHYSFVPRKPEPHGTEFKTVCDGRSGVMLYMEIQEKAEDMALKRFRTGTEGMGGNSACGMRLALGATGRL